MKKIITSREEATALGLLKGGTYFVRTDTNEQMKALESSYSVLKTNDTWGEDEHLPLLLSLYNDLKKL